MKTAPRFYVANTETVHAYQPADIVRLQDVLRAAEDIWYAEWQRQGSLDKGSCCVGKGIEVWYLGKRKRSAEPRLVIRCGWVQGNVSASASVGPALDYLARQGITAFYDDGRMD